MGFNIRLEYLTPGGFSNLSCFFSFAVVCGGGGGGGGNGGLLFRFFDQVFDDLDDFLLPRSSCNTLLVQFLGSFVGPLEEVVVICNVGVAGRVSCGGLSGGDFSPLR
jgi:hypothetical protein